MFLRTWRKLFNFEALLNKLPRLHAYRSQRRHKTRPGLEELEDRRLMSSVTGFVPGTNASSGTAHDTMMPSANVGQAITISGTGFSSSDQIIFTSTNSGNGAVSTHTVNPKQVGPGGTTLVVAVPDDAKTGIVKVSSDGGPGVSLQVVPTLVDVFLQSAQFLAGQNMSVYGSGFVEGSVSAPLKIHFGSGMSEVVVTDTDPFSGPDVVNPPLNVLFDRTDNDGMNVTLPGPVPPAGPITIETDGGTSAAFPVTVNSMTGLEGTALGGTPVNGALPSANAGQTIRIHGTGLDIATEVVFPTVDTNGTLSTRVVRPDLASVDGTLAEVRVPNDAITGNVQVIGAAGSFPLQIVPTLKLVEQTSSTQVYLLGSGFTEDHNLSVSFNPGTVTDTGPEIDVDTAFLANDRLQVNIPAMAGTSVSVTTAGGTSAAVTLPVDQINFASTDLAVFPSTSGADAGRLVVGQFVGDIQVLDPSTLAVVRTITRPGASSQQMGLDFLPEAITVQDPVRGSVMVPAGSLIVADGSDTPDQLYYLNPSGAGTILASVPLAGNAPLDESGAVGIAYHLGRHTLFAAQGGGDLITEINPATGAAIRSFNTGFPVSEGDIVVQPGTGNLLVAGSSQRLIAIDPQTARVIGNVDPIGQTQFGTVDLRQQFSYFQDFYDISGLAFDNAGNLLASDSFGQRVTKLKLPAAPTAIQVGMTPASAVDGTPANSMVPSANAGQSITIVGSNYNRFTEVEFPIVNSNGLSGFVRVQADAVTDNGTSIKVVVPDQAVTGNVRVSGAPGTGLFLQITPTLRPVLSTDDQGSFGTPVQGNSISFPGSGLVEANMRVTIGGVVVNDNSPDTLVDTQEAFLNGFTLNRLNGLVTLIVPNQALAGPVKVETAGGSFQTNSIPLLTQPNAELSSIVATAPEGTPTNPAAVSANTGQLITLNGAGFDGNTNVIFTAVAEDGTRGTIVVHPQTVSGTTQMTVVVPALATTGPVTVAGASNSVNLQIVPTLDGINVSSITPNAALRVSGTGIPEGGAGAGQSVTYTFGVGSVTDTSGSAGPDVFSALGNEVEINLTVPGAATGQSVTVTTAGGSASLQLAPVATSSVAAEPQGALAADGVGGNLASATTLNVAPNTLINVTGRINTTNDVDIYKLMGAQAGGVLNLAASGDQGGNTVFRVFDQSGTELVNSYQGPLTNYVLPAASAYYVGYSAYPNAFYNAVTGTGTSAGSPVGDYSLAVRYAGPGVTSLTGINATMPSGMPGDASFAYANTRQTITLHGQNFTSDSHVVFTAFSGDNPENGTHDHSVTPASVAMDGLSLTVVVPDDAVTGPVRAADEAAGLILQIVPTLAYAADQSTIFGPQQPMQLDGGGLIEGAQTILLGNGMSATSIQDLWNAYGPDTINSFNTPALSETRLNAGTNFNLPANSQPGPVRVQTLGGTSAPFSVTFTGFNMATHAGSGMANLPMQASANVGQPITLTGSGFTLATQVLFPTLSSDYGASTHVVTAAQVTGGTSLQVVVPDDAVTGNVQVVGSPDSFLLQIVPTVVQALTNKLNNEQLFTGNTTGQVLGSGFAENDVSLILGAATLVDTGPFNGPDVINYQTIGAGFDRSDNDGINFVFPPGLTAGPIQVRTSGGTSAPFVVSATQIVGTALSGSPLHSMQPSANAGQTIQILGSNLTISTGVVFSCIDASANQILRVVYPDFAKVDGTLIEVRVPNDAMTSDVFVSGQAAPLHLQVVPTLQRVEQDSPTTVSLLGSGFTEDSDLSVTFGSTTAADTGSNIDVQNDLLSNDEISAMSIPPGGGTSVTVTTDGGTSAPVSIASEDPPTVGQLLDLAVFPATAGADAGRYLVAENGGDLQVLNPADLSVVRTITRPGAASNQVGLSFLPEAITVGMVSVPSGSLVVANGADSPDVLYYMNPAGTGTVLASVPLGGALPVDDNGAVGITYHTGRHTLFVLRGNSDLVSEIDPSTGNALRSFHTGYGVGEGDILYRPSTGNLLVTSGGPTRLLEFDPQTGRVIGNFDPIDAAQFGTTDVRQQGSYFVDGTEIGGLAYDNAGNLLASNTNQGRIFKLKLPAAPTALQVGNSMAVAIDGTPLNAMLPSANAGQRIRIVDGSSSGTYNRFTEVEFPRVTQDGAIGYIRVQADAVSADGNTIEVVVPDQAVTGNVRVSGAPGTGLYLQIPPTIRPALPADIGFSQGYGGALVAPAGRGSGGDLITLLGSAFVEAGTRLTIGGVQINDNSISTDVDTADHTVNVTPQTLHNGQIALTQPDLSLEGPVRVDTAGGYFQTGSLPIPTQPLVGVTGIVATAMEGTPANSMTASANTGQLITLNGFGFTSTSSVLFAGVAEDGTRGTILVNPNTVSADASQITVAVPALAVTGLVSVAGSSTSVNLQVVPTLDGISTSSITAGAAIRLSGTGIPEGGLAAGQGVTYTFGPASVTDTSGGAGPDVFSALGDELEINLTVPAMASGGTITVTTAGGSASLSSTSLATPTVHAEMQGGGPDGVGGILMTATNVNVGTNSLTTVTGRIDAGGGTPGTDVDIYRLFGAQAGGIVSVSATGDQGGNTVFRIFDENGIDLTPPVSFGPVTQFVLPARNAYYIGYSAYANASYNPVDGTGTQTGSPIGDYSLAIRYAAPVVTSLVSITASAGSGMPGDATIPAANTLQSMTLIGQNFTSDTRVRFFAYNGDSPAAGVTAHVVTPASVAIDGSSLTVVVPDDAVTGPVGITDEPDGLILQIVPNVLSFTDNSGFYDPPFTGNVGASMTLTGGGLIEAAQTILLGSGMNTVAVQDVWSFAGPDTGNNTFGPPINQTRTNSATTFSLPVHAPAGPVRVQTLGGTSAPYSVPFTGFAMGTTSTNGIPTNNMLPSANVGQLITLKGTGFTASTQVIFPRLGSGDDLPTEARIALPTSVAGDGSSLQVIVPDDAATGNVGIVGAPNQFFLQIVPTLVQVVLTDTFITGHGLTFYGSGFIENNVTIALGPTFLLDTGFYIGPDVQNGTVPTPNPDRQDNDTISFLIPPDGTNGPFLVKTDGGTTTLGVFTADLGVTNMVDNATPNPSATVHFTAHVANSGPDAATGVLLGDVLPAGLNLIAVVPNVGSYDTMSGLWNVGDLSVNGSASLTLTATVTGSGTISDVASVNHSDESDANPNNDAATATLTVNVVEHNPVANKDTYSMNEDTTLVVGSASGVLANDTDQDGDPLTVTGNTNGAHGTASVNSNGAFAYTPSFLFKGTDSFTYTISDGQGGTATATVGVIVNFVNHSPLANNDSYSVNGGSTLTVSSPGVLANDTDLDNDPLTIALLSSPTHGTFTGLVSNGNFTYTPSHNYSGPDSFTYTLADGHGGSATATVSITVVNAGNHAPVANKDTYSVDEDTTLSVASLGVLSNDFDVDGDPLIATMLTLPAHGTATLQSNGAFVYTPLANYNGTDSFTYRADDQNGGLSTATVSIVVNAVNDAPVANNDSYNTNEDVQLSVTATAGVLANDTDVDPGTGQPETLTAILVGGASHGTVTLQANGAFQYLGSAHFNGTDSFTYKVDDNAGGSHLSNTATVTIVVSAVNNAPLANNDSYSTNEDVQLSVTSSAGVLANDTDVDPGTGQPETLTAILVGGASHGTVTLQAGGAFQYQGSQDFNGTDSFTYKVDDNAGGSHISNTATVTIVVNAVNDAPVANNDSYSVNEDTTLSVAVAGVLGNDTDVDPGTGQPETLTAILVGGASHGTVTLQANGAFTYLGSQNFNGTDSFTYKVDDNAGGSHLSNTATVTIVVNAINDAPVANNDSYSVNEDTLLTAGTPPPGVLANDTDVDPGTGQPETLTAILIGGASHGTVTLQANGAFQYQGSQDFNGTDSFTYKVDDNAGGAHVSNTATVTIVVGAVNDAPVANNDSYSAIEDLSFNVSAPGVLGNDTDVDPGTGQPETLTAILVGSASHGTATLQANGAFTYLGSQNFNGTDSFTYKVDDNAGGAHLSNTATVTIVVNAVNDAPVANNDSYSVNEDTTLSVAGTGVLGNDTDVDPGTGQPQTLTSILVGGAGHGTVTLQSNGAFSYQGSQNFNGTDSFTYKVDDGGTGTHTSNTATVTIVVNAVNDAPVANNDSYSVNEDTTLSVATAGVLGNDTDVDPGTGQPETLTAILVGVASHGTVTLQANGAFTYLGSQNFNGTDSFTYKVDDNAGGSHVSNTATVTIVINAVNDAPVANNDSYSVNEDTTLSVAVTGVLGNDTDVDPGTGQPETLTAVLVGPASHGTVTLQANGAFSYVGSQDFNGTDSFTYKVDDNAGGSHTSNTATVTIVVGAVNDAPVANNDSYSINEDTTLSVATAGVLGNDTDVDPGTGQPETLTAILVGGASHGTVTLQANGAFTYLGSQNFNGTDSFTYKVDDNAGGSHISNTATVTLVVNAVNDAPVANNDSYSVNEDTTLSVATAGVLANDTDVDPGTGQPETLTALLVAPAAHGTVTLQGNGAFTYINASLFNGTDNFTYKVDDNAGGAHLSNTATVLIVVNHIDHKPTANNDVYSVAEDGTLAQAAPGVLGNDTDVDGDSLTSTNASVPAHGAVVLQTNGAFIYTPTPLFSGTDSFNYTLNDGHAGTATGTVTVVIGAVNHNPVANRDTYSVDEDVTLSVASAAGVLANDTDADLDPLTATLLVPAGHGTATLQSNGAFVYAPASNYNGTDNFSYTVNDGHGGSATATVSIIVNAVNDAPVANNDSYSVNEDTPLTVGTAGVLGNDTDVDPGTGQPETLTAILVSGASRGTVTLQANGAFTYQGSQDFNGTDSFTYKVDDNAGAAHTSNTATVTIVVNAINDAPVANNDSYSVNEDTTLTAGSPPPGVLANDTDVDPGTGQPETLTAVLVGGVSHGTLTLQANGAFQYQGIQNFNGTDSFAYKVDDNAGGSHLSNTATVTIVVNAVNDAPVANNDSYSVSEDVLLSQATPGVLANDTDVDPGTGQPQTLTALLVGAAGHGTVTLQANGAFQYQGGQDFNGTDSFTYKVDDGGTGAHVSNAATVTIVVNAVNDAPVANNDSYSVNEDTTLSVAMAGVLGNDTDVDPSTGQPETLTAVLVGSVSHGTLTLQANGAFTYVNAATFHGTDSFTYKVDDGSTGAHVSNTATVTLVVNHVNHKPAANSDSYSVAEDATLSVGTPGVLGNDTDVDGDTLASTILANAGHGTATLQSNGAFVYTPTPLFHGTDSFTYTLDDGHGGGATATVTVLVNAVNHNPVANKDTYSANEDTPLSVAASVSVLANDTDVDLDALSSSLLAPAGHGTATLQSNGAFVYTPASNFNGTDSFTYTLSDGHGGSATGTVFLVVNAVNDAPLANNDSYSVNEDVPLSVVASTGVLANDTDVDPGTGQPETLTAVLVGGSSHGTVTLQANGAFTYQASQDFNGTDSFTYKVDDGGAGSHLSNTATVTIVVNAVNDPPVANNDSYSVNEDVLLSLAAPGVLGNDTDVDPSTGQPETLTALLVGPALHGTVTLNSSGAFTYQGSQDFNGTDSFTYKVDDGGTGAHLSNTATVTIVVNAINDAPVANSDSYSVNEDSTLSVTAAGVLANDTDVDPGTGQPETLTAILVGGVSHGTLTLQSNGAFQYLGSANFNGTDSFTYKVDDGSTAPHVSNTATVTIVVNAVNDAPLANNDSYSVDESATLVVGTLGVLANDTDLDPGTGQPQTLTALLAVTTAHGTLTLRGNGSFQYTPAPGFFGSDSFTYLANDGGLSSSTATVALTVNLVDQPPVANNDSYSVAENNILSVGGLGVLANDTDSDGPSSLTAILMSGAAHGTVSLSANGKFTYTPSVNFAGTDSFTYKANDGVFNGNVATVTLLVSPGPTDVTNGPPHVTAASSGLVRNFGTGIWTGTITVTNPTNSGVTLQGPFEIVLPGLTPGVTPLAPTDPNTHGVFFRSNGDPYYRFGTATTTLAPGASFVIQVRFSNTSNANIHYGTDPMHTNGAQIFAGPADPHDGPF